MFEGRQKKKLEQKLKQEVKRRLKKRMKQKKLKLQNERKKLTQQKMSDFFPRAERAFGATPTATPPAPRNTAQKPDVKVQLHSSTTAPVARSNSCQSLVADRQLLSRRSRSFSSGEAPRNTAQKPDVKVQLHSTGCAIRVARLSDSDAGDEDDVKDQKQDVEDTKPDVSVKERCDKDNTAQKNHDVSVKDKKPDVEDVEGNNKTRIIRRVKSRPANPIRDLAEARPIKRSRLVIDYDHYDGQEPTVVEEPLVDPPTQRHANSSARRRAIQHMMQQHDYLRILRGTIRHVKRDIQEGLYVIEARGANTRRAVDVRSQTVADPVPSKKDPNPTYPCQCCMSTMTWTEAEVSRRRLGYQEEYTKFLRAAGNLNNVPGKGLNF